MQCFGVFCAEVIRIFYKIVTLLVKRNIFPSLHYLPLTFPVEKTSFWAKNIVICLLNDIYFLKGNDQFKEKKKACNPIVLCEDSLSDDLGILIIWGQ